MSAFALIPTAEPRLLGTLVLTNFLTRTTCSIQCGDEVVRVRKLLMKVSPTNPSLFTFLRPPSGVTFPTAKSPPGSSSSFACPGPRTTPRSVPPPPPPPRSADPPSRGTSCCIPPTTLQNSDTFVTPHGAHVPPPHTPTLGVCTPTESCISPSYPISTAPKWLTPPLTTPSPHTHIHPCSGVVLEGAHVPT